MINRIKLFLDTEFTGLHQDTTLISIALVSERGEEFYAELTDFNASQVNPWIEENVLQHLLLNQQKAGTVVSRKLGGPLLLGGPRCDSIRGSTAEVATALQSWLKRFGEEELEIWSDLYAYDWVLFCELFGGAFGLPKNIYYIPFDLSTMFRILGIDPDVSRESFSAENGWSDSLPKHNSLHDARVQLECFRVMTKAVGQSEKLRELRLSL